MMDKGKTSGMKELCLHIMYIITGKYGVYFPCDGTTEETSYYDDGDFELMES